MNTYYPRSVKYIRAFSLIEAVIVLAIAGVVLGGIWIASATVSENLRISRAVEGIYTIATRINKRLTVADYVASSVPATSTWVAYGVIPDDWIGNNRIVDPWGHTVGMTFPAASYPRVDIYIPGLSQQSCRKLVLAAAQHIRSSGVSDISNTSATPYLYRIYTDSAWVTFPVNPQGSFCLQPTNNQVTFVVSITRNN